ncbi:MAG TPA: glycosyltransferase [Methanomicrobiales archaeon]|nr:glycosyltransferase [Methanomicrobiales archaeon]
MNPVKEGDLPLVSICIPTYNRAAMVGDAIRSALSQTYPAIEVVVVDNASSDGAAEVVASLADPRLRFIRNDQNLGLFGNFNRCIELAKGSLIHILHSDDMIPPEFTRTCVGMFLAHPEVAMTFTRTAGEGSGGIHPGSAGEDRVFRPPEGFRAILLYRGLVACPSVMVRKEVYAEIGPFATEYPYSSDLYQWLRLSRQHAIALVGGTHVTYRQGTHTESYRLLFESPQGYQDTAGILARVIGELGDERDRFTPDLNIALTRFVWDCLYAMCTRGRQMTGFRPSFLAGIARDGCALIRPRVLPEKIRKALLRVAIRLSPFACSIPGLGRVILAFQGKGEINY